jgi:uncharacterized sulfatase
VLSLVPAVACAADAKPKNVLFIAVDDLNTRIACFGDPIAKTPNIDALAKRGVMFRNAFCQYPLCNPSRASIMTGLRPDTLKVYDLELNFRKTHPDVITLPQLFRNNNYFDARVGKIYHYGVPRQIGTDGKDDPLSWDYRFNPIGRDRTEESEITMVTRGGYKNTIGFSLSWRAMDGPDVDQTDAKGVTETIRLLKEYKDKPFFIADGFFRPHTPFIAPQKYFDLYPPESIKLPVRDAESDKNLPDIARNIEPDNYGVDEDKLRDCVRAYYASVSFVDAQVGRLVAALDELGLRDNTLIVFWSDHGFLLGEHGQWQKQLLFRPAPNTPMIICDPSARGNGTASDRMVELLDVYPTIANWAGLKAPENLEGHDLKPLLDNPKADWHPAAFSQVTRKRDGKEVMGYCVQTEAFRYIEWDNGDAGMELYDRKADPNELKNLSSDAPHAEILAKMKKLLEPMKRYKPSDEKEPRAGE